MGQSGRDDASGRLWVGADVVWAAPERKIGPHLVRRGMRGTVRELGQGGATRATVALARRGAAPGSSARKRGAKLLVAMDGGFEIRADAKDLEPAPMEHPLIEGSDFGAAEWFLRVLAAETTELTVGTFVPRTFPAVARVLHPWPPRQEGLPWRTWTEVGAASGHATYRALSETRIETDNRLIVPGFGPATTGHLPLPVATALVALLRAATRTPEHVHVGFWDGYGDEPHRRYPNAPRFHRPTRSYVQLQGPLDGVLQPLQPATNDAVVAGYWWPADHTWIVMTEIDYDWTFVAGSTELIHRVTHDPAIEATVTSFDAPAWQPE